MIENINNFITIIQKVGFDSECEIYYRGHSDSTYELIPSIYRNNYIVNEDKIFREFILRTPHEFSLHRSTLEKLVKMQHYGGPTRLLDITSNPLVALYFACNQDYDKDKNGKVVCLKIPKSKIKFFDSDTISILSNIAQMTSFFEFENYDGLKISQFNEQNYIKYLLYDIKKEKPNFMDIINPKHIEQVFAVKVKLDNHRILKQSGAFLIFGVIGNKMIPSSVPSDWILNDDDFFNLKIPSEKKALILKELDLLGINQSTLFPEIDYQSKHLKMIYK